MISDLSFFIGYSLHFNNLFVFFNCLKTLFILYGVQCFSDGQFNVSFLAFELHVVFSYKNLRALKYLFCHKILFIN